MPARSALVGLAAAALGIRRDDQAGQDALGAALVTAAAQIRPGTLMTDFHTFQSLNQAAKGAATRADALRRKDQVETAITRRDYRTDGMWLGAWRLRAGTLGLRFRTSGRPSPLRASYCRWGGAPARSPTRSMRGSSPTTTCARPLIRPACAR